MATSYRTSTMKFRTMAETRTMSRHTLSHDNAFLSYEASYDASYDKNASYMRHCCTIKYDGKDRQISYDAIVLHYTWEGGQATSMIYGVDQTKVQHPFSLYGVDQKKL